MPGVFGCVFLRAGVKVVRLYLVARLYAAQMTSRWAEYPRDPPLSPRVHDFGRIQQSSSRFMVCCAPDERRPPPWEAYGSPVSRPPHGGPGFDQSHLGRVSAVGLAL